MVAITLDNPVIRGETEISDLKLRKPRAGELRGLQLVDVLKLDVKSLVTLLPRITMPPLTSHEVEQLDSEDLLTLGSEVAGFFLTRAEKTAAGLPA
ncbi:MAG: phage tail assembly protein [Caulobacter sp.]|nr:phage tail assembly protein [Caulobacter sp.]